MGSLHEGFPYAVDISNRGYNAFVLKYRVGRGGSVATEDLAAALSFIMRNAGALGVATTEYSLWGSSAGARMAAAIGSHGTAKFGAAALPKPSALVLLYTGHSDLAVTEPPTFVAVGEADGIAPPAVMERRVAALRRAGTDVEYHRYRGVGHGFGLGVGTDAEGWVADAVRFWARHIKRESVHRTQNMIRFMAMLTMLAGRAAFGGGQMMVITRGGSRACGRRRRRISRGSDRVEMLFEAVAASGASGGSVTFDPGARAAWHSHPGGRP